MADDVINQENVEQAAPTPAPSDHQPPALRDLAERARTYADAASSANTRKAYAADWKHFAGWCRREGLDADAGPSKTQIVIIMQAPCDHARRFHRADHHLCLLPIGPVFCDMRDLCRRTIRRLQPA